MHPFKEKTIVFSGKFPGFNRTQLEAYAKANDIRTVKGISKKVDYFIVGQKVGDRKRQKANQLGIPVYAFEEFKIMLERDPSANFWSVNPTGTESATDFLQCLQQLDWTLFNPVQHGEALRNLLWKQEALHGIHTAHKYVFQQIKAHLHLVHPYGHDGPINGAKVSPDGQWLATTNWLKAKDYYPTEETSSQEHWAFEGGILQIWELKTGRVVNQFKVKHGIGWAKYEGIDCIAWSPDSQEIALSYNTNVVGVWNPFRVWKERISEPKVFASITDGWNRPPEFLWSGDGKSVFIKQFYFPSPQPSPRPESERGCWIDTYRRKGNIANLATFGHSDDRTTPVFEPSTTDQPNYPAPIIEDNSVLFPHLQDGTGKGAYHNSQAGAANPLYINNKHYNLYHSINPVIPISLDGQTSWGLAYSNGMLVAPKAFPAAKYLNFSLAGKWTWPLEWGDYVHKQSLAELKGEAQSDMPIYLRIVLKEI